MIIIRCGLFIRYRRTDDVVNSWCPWTFPFIDPWRLFLYQKCLWYYDLRLYFGSISPRHARHPCCAGWFRLWWLITLYSILQLGAMMQRESTKTYIYSHICRRNVGRCVSGPPHLVIYFEKYEIVTHGKVKLTQTLRRHFWKKKKKIRLEMTPYMQSRIKKHTHTQTGVAASFSFPSHQSFSLICRKKIVQLLF